ncbi:DUF4268 domain-containing protein [Gluconobacter oxydans]|uniref:DUF4268 domain-containing protein n=1 Tax=Gluconobacter oxydans TaxID=442 RepID=UPI0039E90F57
MYRVDLTTNRISRLTQKRFCDLALRERDHLQEWLVHQPDALGEELLILQKEFDGFDETRERLDLLALDKEGNLVVIENKLDDSGRDVTWQALKYTAYVSTLKTVQIVEVFQKYLDRYCNGGSASEKICEFLDIESLQDASLNPGNGQRMIFVAANFRREVTATVMWLISRGVMAQCFRVTPFTYGEELFLDLQQIIPPPEAEDYMIGISSKEVEEAAAQGTRQRALELRFQFWAQVLARLQADGVGIYANISPSRDHWLNAGSGVRSCSFSMIFSYREVRVELSLSRSEASENKHLFDQLFDLRNEIETTFGHTLDWRRMDDKKACRIVYARVFDGYNKDCWPDMITWLSEHIQALVAAIQGPLRQAGQMLHLQDEGE